jgi:hypothetical protein
MESRVEPFAPFRVIESAVEMLRGEIIIFCPADEAARVSLKMSNANEFSDSMTEIWSAVRFIGTGSTGRFSVLFLLHDTDRIRIANKRPTGAVDFMFFMG